MRVDWEKGDDEAGTGDVGPGVTLAPGRSLTQWKWSVRLETEVLKPVLLEPSELAQSLCCPQDDAPVWRRLVQACASGCVNMWPAWFLALEASDYGKPEWILL